MVVVVVLTLCSRAVICARGVFCADYIISLKLLRRKENFRLLDSLFGIICDDELVAMCMSVVYVMI